VRNPGITDAKVVITDRERLFTDGRAFFTG
jgi:hypothetical protein